MSLTYEALIRELFPRLTGGVRWGLERTAELLERAGNPQDSFRSIHVGGTNGKGSVAATLASMLRAAGHRTGLYTSPHLCTFRERIQLDGQAISEDALLSAARVLWDDIQRLQPSFFEATTAIAFVAMAEAGVEAAVVEVGLGGRLDSTNVIKPDVAVITNIALDHADYLGHTLDAIAREKAGIIKAGVPVATAETEPAALAVFAEQAKAVGAALHRLDADPPQQIMASRRGTDFQIETAAFGTLQLHTPLIGRHQARNCALAVLAAGLLPVELRPRAEAVVRGVAEVRWPGRLQIEQIGEQCWVFDVAHNVAGVEALVDALAALDLPRPLVLLVGILGDKDWQSMLPPLYQLSDAAVLTVPPTAPPNRAWQPERVLAEVPAQHGVVDADFRSALARAAQLAENGTVLVTGSFHTVGDALTVLGRAPFGSDVTLPHLTISG